MPADLTRGGLAAVVTAVLSPAVSAAEAVEPVTVTATRTAQSANEALSSVTVLDRATIERSSARSLPDLLGDQRGLSLSRNGPYGKASSLFMRGTESDHVLVLIDGVKIGSATTGATAFQHLPLNQIERIEIVRGPRSSLYGSDAIGGVVQIFTRSGDSDGLQAQASGMRGSDDTSELATTISGGNETTQASISGKKLDSDGIDVTNTGSPDTDGYSNDTASGSITHELGDAATISASGFSASGESAFDPFGGGTADRVEQFRQRAVTSALDVQPTSWWSATLSGGRTTDESRNLTDGRVASEFETERDEVRWQNDFTLGARHVLTVGYDYRDEQISSTTDFDQTERDNHAGFAQWQWTGAAFDAQISGRYDDNEAFGSKGTGSVAGGYRIGAETRIFASYGTAFKTPTFNDLFIDTPFFNGNPDLDPEESRSAEVGVRGNGSVRWSASAYRTEIDDLIQPTGATVENVNEAEINGLELSVDTTSRGWDLGASATLLDTEIVTDDGSGNDGNELARRPERTVQLTFGRDIGAFRLDTTVHHESERFDDTANTTELDGFTRLDFSLEYTIRRDLSVRATVQNAGDTDYQTVDGFETRGRTGRVRLTYRM